jgi:hypothetical protein
MPKSFSLENVPGRVVRVVQDRGPSMAIRIAIDVSNEEKLRKSLDTFFPGAAMLSKAIAADESAGVDVQMHGSLVDVKLVVRAPGHDEPIASLSMARVKGRPKLSIGDKAKSMRIDTTVCGAVDRKNVHDLLDAARGEADVFVDIAAAQLEIEDAREPGEPSGDQVSWVDNDEAEGDEPAGTPPPKSKARNPRPQPKPSAKKKPTVKAKRGRK